MVVYTCPRCSFNTSSIIEYKKHLRRKSACTDTHGSELSVDEILKKLLESKSVPRVHTCDECGEVFKSRQTKYYHRKTLHGSNLNTKAIVQLVSGCASQPLTINIIQNQHNNTNSNNTTVNQNVNAFGNEGYQYMMEDKHKMTTRFLSQAGGWIKAAEELYYNDDHPENKTVKITNKKLPYAKIYDGSGKWVVEETKKVLEDMIVAVKNIMDEYVETNEQEIRDQTRNMPKLFDRAKEFLYTMKDVIDESDTVTPRQIQDFKQVLESLKCLVINNSF
jgi:hypothetical protein